MKWSGEAEGAVKKVPFFVRKKVVKKIEQYVLDNGRNFVTIEDTRAARKEFLSNMSKDIKGYQADGCFSSSGCPHAANGCASILKQAELLLKSQDILGFLKQNVSGKLKYHHEFRLSTADCPNACSQPQIKDMGIIGAVQPEISEEPCSMCQACVHVCPDDCITLNDNTADELNNHDNAADELNNHDNAADELNSHAADEMPVIDFDTCLMCGKCIEACPTGTIREEKRGFRVLLGGCLGRHPRLALELPGILSAQEVLAVLGRVLDFYKEKSTGGARFAKIFHAEDLQNIVKTNPSFKIRHHS